MCVYVCAIVVGKVEMGCIELAAPEEALAFDGEEDEVGDSVVVLERMVVRFEGVDGAEKRVVGAIVSEDSFARSRRAGSKEICSFKYGQ